MFSILFFHLSFFLVLCSFTPSSAEASQPTSFLILNMNNESILPRNFRATTLPFMPSDMPIPSRLGLDELQASGSGQFSENSLKTLLKTLPNSKVIIVDLREESHGFLNGTAVSWRIDEMDWGNIGLSLPEIILDEEQHLTNSLNNKSVLLYGEKELKNSSIFNVEYGSTEAELVESLGIGYLRMPVTNHVRPSNHTIDQFIQFVLARPSDTWLHFHCSAGRGRTGTFLIMLDMIHNARQVSIEDIFARHALIGGKDFSIVPADINWKYDFALERVNLLKKFYLYCQESNSFVETWSSWNETH